MLVGKFTSAVDVVLEGQRAGRRVVQRRAVARRALRQGQQVALGHGRGSCTAQADARVCSSRHRLASYEASALVHVVQAGAQRTIVVRLYHSLYADSTI